MSTDQASLLPEDDDPRTELSPEEYESYAELARADTPLANLLLYGVRLCSRSNEPGVGYLIAHAGRELGKGVIHNLTGIEPLPPPEQPGDSEANEAFASLIGRALQLDPRHGTVREWADLQRKFNADAHLRPNPPGGDKVARNFRRLLQLVFGAVAPYFVTHAALEDLLKIADPAPEDAARLKSVLMRPTQRRHFFASAQTPGWLPLLIDEGAFSRPPQRLIHADGNWSLVTWFEGEYLVRMAPLAPDAVVRALRTVPRNNDNPAVWDTVARAAVSLPV